MSNAEKTSLLNFKHRKNLSNSVMKESTNKSGSTSFKNNTSFMSRHGGLTPPKPITPVYMLGAILSIGNAEQGLLWLLAKNR